MRGMSGIGRPRLQAADANRYRTDSSSVEHQHWTDFDEVQFAKYNIEGTR